MNTKTGILATTALFVAGVMGATAHPAAASTGCGVSLDVHNKTSSDITVDWADSDSRAKVVVAGTWKELDTGTTVVSPGAITAHAVTLDLSCSTNHQYRLEVNQNGSSWFVYFPANTSNWTKDASPHVDVN
jgi:hypothetical protein